jgi:hypothetical protein
LPRSHSHNGPTNPKNKSKQLQSGSTTQEVKHFGQSACLGRIVRSWIVDGLLRPSGRSDAAQRTVQKVHRRVHNHYEQSELTPQMVRPARERSGTSRRTVWKNKQKQPPRQGARGRSDRLSWTVRDHLGLFVTCTRTVRELHTTKPLNSRGSKCLVLMNSKNM